MTLIISSPSGAGNKVGPGYYLSVSQTPSLGVVGQSLWELQLVVVGSQVAIHMQLPWQSAVLNTYMGGPNNLDPLAANQAKLMTIDPGAAVDMHVIMFTSSGVIGEQITQAQVWDPTGCLYNLAHYSYVTGGAGHDPMLDTILAAVQQLYTNAV